jgi:hypothetical protein
VTTSPSDGELRTAIEDCLRTYCRGIDRLRPELIAAGFHAGATLHDYGPQPMTIETFAEYAPSSLRKKFVATQHRISNISIERHVDHAVVETYVHATHLEQTADGRRLHSFMGRYVDRFEPRDGVWKIAQRTLRNDWSTITAADQPMGGNYVPSGRGDEPDPLWA